MKSARGRCHCLGLTQVDLLVMGVMVFALWVLIFLSARPKRVPGGHLLSACRANQKQITLGFRLYANDHNNQFPWQVSTSQQGTLEWLATTNVYLHFQAVSNELTTPKILRCPTDVTRPGTNTFEEFRNNHLSYFLGTSADPNRPSTILGGDRNLVCKNQFGPGHFGLPTNLQYSWSGSQHIFRGNIALADGSVRQTSNRDLNRVLQQSGLATNWLAFP